MRDTPAGKAPVCSMAAALFSEPTSLHDAVADLREAGFGNLGVAFSTEPAPEDKRAKVRRARKEALTGEEHSRSWRVRHGFESDLHQKGAEVFAGEGSEILGRMEAGIITPQGESGMPSGAPRNQVDLQKTLHGMGVPQYRIDLVDREIGPERFLLLVEVGDRSQEAQEILERNRGINRTDTAVERPPENAAEHPGKLEFQVMRETIF